MTDKEKQIKTMLEKASMRYFKEEDGVDNLICEALALLDDSKKKVEPVSELINTWNEYLDMAIDVPEKRDLCNDVNTLIGEVCDRLEAETKRADKAESKNIEDKQTIAYHNEEIKQLQIRNDNQFGQIVSFKEVIKQLQQEIEDLKELPRCPCGGELEGLGHDIKTKDEVWQCKKCKAQMIVSMP